MKLVIIIPAYNEENTIKETIMKIPKKIPGIDKLFTLVIDDGSEDKTADVALNAGADKVISHRTNLGVGAAFMTGVRNSIQIGADIIVTLDADSQFDPNQIGELVVPILNKEHDVVIGSRFLKEAPSNIPKIKLAGNKIFSKIVGWAVNQRLSDTQTGFRAYSRDALLKISVVNNFTYTQEVLIDLKFKGMRIGEIPVKVTYDDARKSRVVKNIFSYSYKAILIIVKSLVFHKPILTFGLFGAFLISIGIIAKILTKIDHIIISAGLSTGLIILGIVSFMMGLFASVVFNRQTFSENDLRHYIENLNREETKS